MNPHPLFACMINSNFVISYLFFYAAPFPFKVSLGYVVQKFKRVFFKLPRVCRQDDEMEKRHVGKEILCSSAQTFIGGAPADWLRSVCAATTTCGDC